MRALLAIARKEVLLLAQKPGSWVIVFLVPFLFTWIMMAVFGGSGTPTVTVYAVNQDDSDASRRVMSALRDADHLEIEVLETREEADRRVGAGERMAALVLPPGFGRRMTTSSGATVEVIVDPARAEQANIVLGLVNAALGPIMVDAEVTRGVEAGVEAVLDQIAPPAIEGQESAGLGQEETAPLGQGVPTPGALVTPAPAGPPTPTPTAAPNSRDALRTFFTAALKGVASSQVQQAMDDPQVAVLVQGYSAGDANPEALRPPTLLDYLVPGYSLMFLFFLIPNLALTMVEERESGAFRRLLVAPVSRSLLLLGKMLPYFAIGAVQLSLVLAFSHLLFGIDLGNSWVGLGIVILASALAMASLGILIAAWARSESQADGLAVVLVLAMAVVSGAMFPSIQIPGLQLVTPHYWSMQGFLNIIARGQGTEGAFLPAGILLTMAAVFFTVGAVRFHLEE